MTKDKFCYVKFDISVLFEIFLILVILTLINLYPMVSHSKITANFKTNKLGPCFVDIGATNSTAAYKHFSGYSIIVDTVYIDKNKQIKEDERVMNINGKEYILK